MNSRSNPIHFFPLLVTLHHAKSLVLSVALMLFVHAPPVAGYCCYRHTHETDYVRGLGLLFSGCLTGGILAWANVRQQRL
ncbi:MAG: hypothetical protein AAGD07_03960 [Planctomycetota bacterium]